MNVRSLISKRFLTCGVFVTLILCAGPAGVHAQTITLAWDPNSESSVVGYIIGYGTAPGANHGVLDVGMSTAWTVSELAPGVTYYFRVYAYDTRGARSEPSNEVWTTIPGANGCTTPDPFASMGGGTCHDGGWLAPGMPAGSTNTTTQSTATQSAATHPVASVGTCSTPDPFVSMGGGTCYNGGWLPPGMPIPASVGTTVSQPVASVATCSTPDPFTALGGGTCYNGGWLPPGMPIPSGVGTKQPQPAPPAPGTCATPDPFVSIPGLIGLCVNGGWVPIPLQ